MKDIHQQTARLLTLIVVLFAASVLSGQKSSSKAKLADFRLAGGPLDR